MWTRFRLFVLGMVVLLLPFSPARARVAAVDYYQARTPELLAELGDGTMYGAVAVPVLDDHILIGLDRQVAVVDVTTANNPQIVAKSQSLDNQVLDVTAAGQAAYALLTSCQLVILDLSDPLQPDAVEMRDLVSCSYDSQLYATDRLLFVGSLTQPGMLFTIDNPMSPVSETAYTPPAGTLDMGFEGSLGAFLTETQLFIVDFTDPLAPVQVSQTSLPIKGVHLVMDGDLLVVLSNPGIVIYQFGPTPVKKYQSSDAESFPFDQNSKAIIHNKLLYAVNLPYSGYTSDVGRVYDLSNPAAPAILKKLTGASLSAQDLIVTASGRLVVAGQYTGLHILDISDLRLTYDAGTLIPTRYQEIAPGTANRFFVLNTASELISLDTNVPNAPTMRGKIPKIYYMASNGNFVYAYEWTGNLTAFDFTNPDVPVRLASIRLDESLSQIISSGTTLYAVTYLYENGTSTYHLRTYNFANPNAPVLSSSIVLANSYPVMTVSNGFAFVSGGDYKKISLYSLASPLNPVFKSDIVFADAISFTTDSVVVAQPYAFMAINSSLRIYDLSNPANPSLVAQPANIQVNKIAQKSPSTLYAWGWNGLMRLNIGDPLNPKTEWMGSQSIDELAFAGESILARDNNGMLKHLREYDTFGMRYDNYSSPIDFTPFDGFSVTAEANSFWSPVTFFARRIPIGIFPNPAHNIPIAPPVHFEMQYDYGITSSNLPMHVQIHYNAGRLLGVDESELGLYRWEKTKWIPVPEAVQDGDSDTFRMDLSQEAILGIFFPPLQHTFLPVVSSGSGQDVWIDALELTQEIQRADNSVPLVAGRDTLLRIHARAMGSLPSKGLTVMVQATLPNGVELAGSPIWLGPLAVFPSPDRTVWGQTYNLLLPEEWTHDTINLTAELDADHILKEGREDNNFTSLSAQFSTRGPLRVVIVPIAYTDKATGKQIPAPTIDRSSNDMLKTFPLSAIKAEWHAAISFSGDLSTTGGWQDMLGKVTSIRNSENAASTDLYYGAIETAEGVNLLYGGMGWIGIRASVGYNGGVIVHEAGHNFGLPHAPCGVSGDSSFPYPDALIGQWGIDFKTLTIKDPQIEHDLMSYCGGSIFSDYYYQKLIPQMPKATAPNAQSAESLQAAALIRVDLQAGVLLPVYTFPAEIYPADPLPEDPSLRAQIVFLDSLGNVIGQSETSILVAQEDAEPLFSINALVPLPEGAVGVRVESNGRIIAERTLGATGVSLVRVSPDGGQTWQTVELDLPDGAPRPLGTEDLLLKSIQGQ